MSESGRSARDIVVPDAAVRPPGRGALAVLAPHWRTIAFFASLAAMAVATVWLVSTPPQYTASASIMTTAGTRPGIGVGGDGDLVSRAVLARVVDQRHLADDTEFTAGALGWRERALSLVGLGPVAGDRRSVAVETLGRAVAVRRAFRTYTIDATARDWLEATYLADAVAEAAVEAHNAAPARTADTASSEHKGSVAILHARLVEAETQLRAFEQESGVRAADAGIVDDRRLTSLEAELGRAKARVVDAKAAAEELQQLLRSGRIPEVPAGAAASTAFERALIQYQDAMREEATDRITLGDRHPAYVQVQARLREARRQVTAELRQLAGAAAARLAAARIDEAALVRQVEDARPTGEPAAGPRSRLRALQRAVDAARADYVTAVQGDDTTASLPGQPEARVVTLADVPNEPAGPDRLVTLGLVLAAGALAGIAFAAWRVGRRLPPGARHASVSQPDFADSPATDVVLGSHHHDARSALRSDRAGVVLVTSDAAGAGKSTIALSLVRAACERGERTLLIEADSARPSLARLIEAGAVPTLIELAGATRPSFAVDAGADGSFQLMAILGDEAAQVRRLREDGASTIVGLEHHFDFVVIDGPTIGRDEAASVLAEIADQVVLVMPPMARHDRVASAIDRLQVPAHKVRGTVLAAVEHLRIAA